MYIPALQINHLMNILHTDGDICRPVSPVSPVTEANGQHVVLHIAVPFRVCVVETARGVERTGVGLGPRRRGLQRKEEEEGEEEEEDEGE